MQIQFVGCGDAFGSGGRFNTCFHLTGGGANVLIDCGATSLVALKRLGIDRNAIDLVLFTHFHHDHFGGLPFLLEDAQLIARRERPLTLAGPPGLPGRCTTMLEAAFPGSSQMQRRFPLSFRELAIGRQNDLGAIRVTPFGVRHDERAGPCLAHRIETSGKVFAYSGDTEWTEALIEAGRDADLFVCECYTRDKPWKGHLSLKVLQEKLPTIGAKRVILTHMGEDMLGNLGEVALETAEDGKTITF